MPRRCSQCTQNGHNTRTCPNRNNSSQSGIVKLFGVRLNEGSSIRKSASMGNLTHFNASGSGLKDPDHDPHHPAGYASDDFVSGSSSSARDKKKGTPWTEEEHRMFLLGLNKLGKGDWRGISRNYVISRTPTQVASHAQKYFIRQSNVSRRKRRSSLFDIVPDEANENPVLSQDFHSVETRPESSSNHFFPTPAAPPPAEEEIDSMDSSNSKNSEAVATNAEIPLPCYPMMYPAYFAPMFPYSIPSWPGYIEAPTNMETHEVVKPTAVHSNCPINVDELVGMSKLSLGESKGNSGPSSVSLKLNERPRQSAFHANPATGIQA